MAKPKRSFSTDDNAPRGLGAAVGAVVGSGVAVARGAAVAVGVAPGSAVGVSVGNGVTVGNGVAVSAGAIVAAGGSVGSGDAVGSGCAASVGGTGTGVDVGSAPEHDATAKMAAIARTRKVISGALRTGVSQLEVGVLLDIRFNAIMRLYGLGKDGAD